MIFVALNDKEILGQALVFLIAGYETTSALLSFFLYVMATHPDIQEKVYDEIRRELGDVCLNVKNVNYQVMSVCRARLLMRKSANYLIWIWLLMRLCGCIHRSSGQFHFPCISSDRVCEVDSIVLHQLLTILANITYQKEQS